MQRWPDAKSGIVFYRFNDQNLLDLLSAHSAHKVFVESFPRDQILMKVQNEEQTYLINKNKTKQANKQKTKANA